MPSSFRWHHSRYVQFSLLLELLIFVSSSTRAASFVPSKLAGAHIRNLCANSRSRHHSGMRTPVGQRTNLVMLDGYKNALPVNGNQKAWLFLPQVFVLLSEDAATSPPKIRTEFVPFPACCTCFSQSYGMLPSESLAMADCLQFESGFYDFGGYSHPAFIDRC